MRILVVEDQPDMNRLLVQQLTAARYSVDSCHTGTEALDYLAGGEYDAVVLDIMLPGIDGLEVLRRRRGAGDRTPVLLLTARDGIEDRVRGLDSGADDYLVKPFALQELLARLRVLLRRGSGQVSDVITVADLQVDCAAPYGIPGRAAAGSFRQGVCRAGIPGPQRRHGAPPGNGSATGCGITTTRAVPMWWMSTSAICAKRLTTAASPN